METITRQQRRYTERKKKKEENRKPQPVYVLNRYKGFIKSVDGFVSERTYERLNPNFRYENRESIHDVNIKDIKKIVVERYDDGYLDERACIVMKKELSISNGIEEVIDLEQYHKEGQIKGLPDLYRISDTGFGSTRGSSIDEMLSYPYREYHPFVIFDKEGQDMTLPMDSWFLWVWNDKGDLVHWDGTFKTMLMEHRKTQESRIKTLNKKGVFERNKLKTGLSETLVTKGEVEKEEETVGV